MQTILYPTIERRTVLSLIESSTTYLRERGFDEARLHVELLLSHVLKLSRLQLYTSFDRPLTSEEISQFKIVFRRRLTHEPLQYIIGETDFMGIPLTVNKNVLIPRPETELLVEQTLRAIHSFPKERIEILDIGTGSGNIPIAIAKFAPNVSIVSIDVSRDALEVARHNVERNNASNIQLVNASVFDDFLPDQLFDLIVSNPPYIALGEFADLQPEVRDFEPRIATTDEADGVKFASRIAKIATMKLHVHGILLMEIAYNQAQLVRRIVIDAGLKDVEVHEDYAGHPRILSARK
jgi:release factor glutamine methyltransferase